MSSCRALRILGQGLSLLAILSPLAVSAASKNEYKTMCGAFGDSSALQYAGASTDTGKYLYGANQWGWDASGAQCMTVGLDDSDDAASFNVTWSWTERDVWVHSYPNVGLESVQLPSRLDNVKSFNVSAAWDMYPSDQPDAANKTEALMAIGTKADIALDMFIDSNNITSMNASAAAFEVMVWSAIWGGVAPIGYQTFNAEAPKYTLNGVEYSLYSGFNQQYQKQAVYSWVPSENQQGIQADLWELVTYLIPRSNITSDMYIGLIQFGTETVHATSNVTFEMQKAQMDLAVVSQKPTTTKGSPPATAGASKGGAFHVAPTNFALPAAAMGLAAAVLL
ncbi:concanavalin A-like lectin/glucanase [Aureobasidium subglaciale]|uniref:Glycoside hydrolase family 12 protein n=1 Tax=Aureobasidium subglaciale (strain EXF-2481) TaxID=1043005 RepID=A0A074Y5A6_AURSE|nr:glycoside hydrolase family 12 protein [Aureobasidium subglaciale EXF-2481]KAI5196617.1 concanavalin A-like lectin/glucanase [Aureobasidium subglaciale]KAI5215499.1 concanavalin A-like lectin/glucanase [Aureobasidium subglaciale]KAI5218653.1 concanavalin A-like lectin/glucanase [Aureobasidium subglaciale]KAI5245887.1 concanavalin A-like lectin/glucanase [Aureobasidium subglaciale]KAI5256175.1 concanavalin A-like lectin/glucanase [Aureobasidium subglaciale]